MSCWMETRGPIFINGYGLLSFAKNLSKNLSQNTVKKLLGHAKKSATDVPKTASKRAI